MAINIIKQPTNLFTMECERCECVFTYQRIDLVKHISVDYVRCPCCKDDIPHIKRKKYSEDE
jgi:hypothetical protein